MSELDFLSDMVEEKLVRGNLRWLANFTEIHRDYKVGDIAIPIYALGSLQERGFLLSRIFAAFVTPKYKVHLLFYLSNNIETMFLRNLILTCKNKFGPDDWILIELVQSRPIDKSVRDMVKNVADNRVGVVVSSISSKDEVTSENVLGRNLKRQIKLTEAKFETIDPVSYLKSFAIVFILGTFSLILLQLLSLPALNAESLLLMLVFSVLLGYPIYKSRYHMVLKLNSKGFEIWRGKKSTIGKWADFSDVATYIAPNREVYLRLLTQGQSMDLPLSRAGISRRDAYNAIKKLMKKK